MPRTSHQPPTLSPRGMQDQALPQGQRGVGADLGVPRQRGTAGPPIPGIIGDTSLPARCRWGRGAGKQLWLWLLGAGQRHKPPASLDPSPRHRGEAPGGPRCTRTCRLIAGDQWLPVILGTHGDGLTPWGLGNCVRLFSPGPEEWHGTAPSVRMSLSVMPKTRSPSALRGVSLVVTVTSRCPNSHGTRARILFWGDMEGQMEGCSVKPRCHPASLHPARSVPGPQSPQHTVSHPCPCFRPPLH